MTWDVVLRLVNASGCLFSLWLMVLAAYRTWRHWSDKTQTMWFALFGWVFLGFEGSIESIIFGIAPGPRTVLQTLVIAFTVTAFLKSGAIQQASVVPPWKKEDST